MSDHHWPRGMTIDQYLKKIRDEEGRRTNRIMSHGRHNHGNNNIVGFRGGGSRGQKLYGAYLYEGVYYIGIWSDLPFYNTSEIEQFLATDKRDALIKGEKIIEKHYQEQMKLPEEQRVKTIPKKPYVYDRSGGDFGTGYGV